MLISSELSNTLIAMVRSGQNTCFDLIEIQIKNTVSQLIKIRNIFKYLKYKIQHTEFF